MCPRRIMARPSVSTTAALSLGTVRWAMIRRRGDDTANKVDNVSATGSGQAVGINHGTVQQLHFHHEFRRLRDATIDLDPLPADLRLIDPQHTTVLAELAEIDASLT